MTKNNDKIDYRIALKTLKEQMDKAEEMYHSADKHNAAGAYGYLHGSVQAVLKYCGVGETLEDTRNDIPPSHHCKPGLTNE